MATEVMNLNILIAGVGWQGTLLASKIFGNYAQLIGKDCKVSSVEVDSTLCTGCMVCAQTCKSGAMRK